jgi:hypothetical protein
MNILREYKYGSKNINENRKFILKNLYLFTLLKFLLEKNAFILVFQYGSLSIKEKRLLNKKLVELGLNSFFFYTSIKEINRLSKLVLGLEDKNINVNFDLFLKSFNGNFFLLSGDNSSLVNINSFVKDSKFILVKGIVNNILFNKNNLLAYVFLNNVIRYNYLIDLYFLFFNFKFLLNLIYFKR